MLPSYLLRFSVFGVPTNVLEILIGITFLIFLFDILRFFNLRNLDLLDLGVFLVFIGATIGIFVAMDMRSALGIWKGWIIIPIIMLAMIRCVTTKIQDPKTFIDKLFLAAGVSTAILCLFGFHELLNGAESTPDLRLASVFQNANELALLIGPILAYHLFNIFKDKQRLLRLTIIIVLTIGILLTRSYGGLLALFGAVFISLFSAKYSVKIKIGILVLALLGASFLVFYESRTAKFAQMLDIKNRSSSSVRLEIWRVAVFLGEHNAIFGIGPGQFEKNYISQAATALNKIPIEWNHPQPHNLALAFWLQTGLIGIIGAIIIVIAALKILWTNRREALAIPLFCAFLTILIHGVVDTPFWRNDLAIIFWLVAAGISVLKIDENKIRLA
ncbi:MAG: O-antigen ligase family protein [Patescibacteria group bacterium]|nr:O-antigen ligase family protein [Patescibacteria group bacterium]